MVRSFFILCFWQGQFSLLVWSSAFCASGVVHLVTWRSIRFWCSPKCRMHIWWGPCFFGTKNGGERWLSRLPRARCPWLRLLVIEREAATVDDRRQAAARPFMGPPQCSFFECPGWLSFLYCTQLTAHSWWPPRLRRAKRWSGSRPKRGLWGFRVGRVKRTQQG